MIVRGTVRVPGDKSVTHRLLLLAGLAPGRSRLVGALTSDDARSSARVLRQLGVRISPLRFGEQIVIEGRERFRRPAGVLDCGNSGTTARLLMGLLAGHHFRATLTGDASLRRRPMRRVTEPLTRMGARFSGEDLDRLPLTLLGGPLAPLEWELPVSSAQIKSCLLLAGVAGGQRVAFREPNGKSRDHTERLLREFGYQVSEETSGWVRFAPTGMLTPFDAVVPGDPSSAAFLVAAALLAEDGELTLPGVGLNPTRIGFLRVLERMGAPVALAAEPPSFGEPVGTMRVRPATLHGTTIVPAEIPGLIDEVPMLAVLASRARGESRFMEVGELRVKESDRLGLIAENLKAVGARARVEGNALVVQGGNKPPRGRVRTEGDHRIAMAFAVLGTLPGAKVVVDNLACADVSFPRFRGALKSIGKAS